MNRFELLRSQILDRVELLDVVSEHVSLKRSGSRWVGLCPFHNEKTPSFTVSPERGSFKCFGCGKGGDIFTFVQERENVSFVESMRMLADRAGIDFDATPSGGRSGPSRADIAKVNDWASRFFRSVLLDETAGRNVRDYLSSRGISEELSETYQLGLATDNGPKMLEAARRAGIDNRLLIEADLIRRGEDGSTYHTFRERLMFPIRDATKRTVGFGGRTLVDDRAKYLNTRQNPLYDKGRSLYGIDLARQQITESKRAILVEGYTDCMAVHAAGFHETVATLGTALTEAQVDLLRRYCDELILLFDSDQAGEAAADRAMQVALPRHLSVRLARIPDGKDPSEYLQAHSASSFEEVLNTSIDALEFKWSCTQLRFRADQSDSGKREAVLGFLDLIAQTCSTGAMDAIQRGLLVNRVAKLVGLSSQEVHDLVGGLTRKRSRRTAPPSSKMATVHAPPTDSSQAAWSDLLGVLLNEPALLCGVEFRPDIELITDPSNRRVASLLYSMVDQLGEFRISEVTAKLSDPGDRERAIELADRAARRGNFESTIAVALERIASAGRDRDLETAKRSLGTGKDPSEARRTLEKIQEGLETRRHYVPQRLIRRNPGVEDSVNRADKM